MCCVHALALFGFLCLRGQRTLSPTSTPFPLFLPPPPSTLTLPIPTRYNDYRNTSRYGSRAEARKAAVKGPETKARGVAAAQRALAKGAKREAKNNKRGGRASGRSGRGGRSGGSGRDGAGRRLAAQGKAKGRAKGKAGGARAAKGGGNSRAVASGDGEGDDLSFAAYDQAVRHVITRLQALPPHKLGLLGEPTPQHFHAPSGTGLWGDITDQSPTCPSACAPLSGGWEAAPDARGAVVRAAGAALGFPEAQLVPVAHVLRPLHALHLHAKQGCRVDCTHYCYHPRVWEGVLDALYRPIANWARLL